MQKSFTEESPLATAYKECKTPRCKCIAHQSKVDVVWELIDIPSSLTDDWGSKLANALLPEIFKRGNVNIKLEDCKQGSIYYGGREGPSIATSIWRFCNGTMQWKFSMEAHNGSAYILLALIYPKVTLSLVIGAPHLGQHAV